MDGDYYNLHLTGVERNATALIIDSDYSSYRYLFDLIDKMITVMEDLWNHGWFVCDMSADIWYTASVDDVQVPGVAHDHNIIYPKLMTQCLKKLEDVHPKDLAQNKFFDPWDQYCWGLWTKSKKKSRLLSAFLISWITILMTCKQSKVDIDFYDWKRINKTSPSEVSNLKFWLYYYASLTKHRAVFTLFSPFRKFSMLESQIYNGEIDFDHLRWIFKFPHAQLIQPFISMSTTDSTIDGKRLIQLVRAFGT